MHSADMVRAMAPSGAMLGRMVHKRTVVAYRRPLTKAGQVDLQAQQDSCGAWAVRRSAP